MIHYSEEMLNESDKERLRQFQKQREEMQAIEPPNNEMLRMAYHDTLADIKELEVAVRWSAMKRYNRERQ